ncbi:hypothetical protein TBK1r_03070 [Stieleria magnilauensis]|uniref:Uncharacterized protein n=1 Tax=Stieleria magnilauensis TaxID=2527963 RepID=A0ABX5XI11_9BACT|nr:hypothetical protein TBK1r_03070 [Planctomycetes bacterium TBK1r]
MSKKITFPTRHAGTASADKWVQQTNVDRTMPKEKPKRLTIDLAPKLHRKLKLHCVTEDIEIATFIRGLIESRLECSPGVTVHQNRCRRGVYRGGFCFVSPNGENSCPDPKLPRFGRNGCVDLIARE